MDRNLVRPLAANPHQEAAPAARREIIALPQIAEMLPRAQKSVRLATTSTFTTQGRYLFKCM
jgi:hypothetical protein